MLGFALALAAVGAVTGFAYLTRRFPLASGGGGKADKSMKPDFMGGSTVDGPGATDPAAGGSHAEIPADQLVREPNGAAITDPQQGATDVPEAIDASQRANAQVPADFGGNPSLDGPYQMPNQDWRSESSLDGTGSPLDMICGGGEDDPEFKQGGYSGPPIE